MSKFWQNLGDLLSSKRSVMAIIGVVAIIATHYGFELDVETTLAVASLFGILIHSQGSADHGKEAAKIVAASLPIATVVKESVTIVKPVDEQKLDGSQK